MSAVLLFLSRRLKRDGYSPKGTSLRIGIRVLSTKPIAPQKYISLVEIGGEVLALGVSEGQITLLTKVENQGIRGKDTAHGAGRSEAFSLPPVSAEAVSPIEGSRGF